MTTITHPSMKRAGNSPALNKSEGQTTFVVDDPTTDLDKHLEQFEAQERPLMPSQEFFETQKAQKIEVVDPKQQELKNKLEKLIFIGYQLKEVNFLEHKFELNTITNKEHQEMIKEIYDIGDKMDIYKMRSLTLANALKKIDGVKLDNITDKDNTLTDFHRRVELIDNLQLTLVEKLYEEYNNLLEENDALISGANIKK